MIVSQECNGDETLFLQVVKVEERQTRSPQKNALRATILFRLPVPTCASSLRRSASAPPSLTNEVILISALEGKRRIPAQATRTGSEARIRG